MTYTVVVKESGSVVFEQAGLPRKAAIKMAEVKACEQVQVFIFWHRDSDGQIGYLNPGGSYELVGKAW